MRKPFGVVRGVRVIGPRLEILLRKLPSSGPLFPDISKTTSGARAAEFYRRCRLLRIKGVSLHSDATGN